MSVPPSFGLSYELVSHSSSLISPEMLPDCPGRIVWACSDSRSCSRGRICRRCIPAIRWCRYRHSRRSISAARNGGRCSGFARLPNIWIGCIFTSLDIILDVINAFPSSYRLRIYIYAIGQLDKTKSSSRLSFE